MFLENVPRNLPSRNGTRRGGAAWALGGARRGAVLVESALVMTVLLLVTLGGLEYGLLFLRSSQLSNAARDGARVGITFDGTNAAVEDAIDTRMQQAGIDNFTVTISTSDGDDNDQVSETDPGADVTISVSVDYSEVGTGPIGLFPTPSELGGQTTMVKEGF
jgi:Flp pilus assembly protein TadG